MPNVLEVKIIGDVTDLQKSLKQAEQLQAQYTASIEKTSNEIKESIAISAGYKKAIDDLNAAYKAGSVSAKDYSKQLSNLQRDEKESTVVTANLRKELANLKREQKDLGGSFDGATKKVANGGNALMQFSRIVQDAPYGIIGIGNNITEAVGSFSQLQKSAGSTGGALKALAGSIVGSGGVLLAVSLLTTALTYMSQNNLSVGDVLDKLSGNFDNVKKSIQDVNNEAQKNAGAEIANIKALVDIAKNDVNTRKERLAAVEKLQSEYPAYFGNLTKEQILNGNVETTLKAVTFALIQKSKAQIIATKIAENDLKILQKQQEGQKLFADFTAGKGAFAILKGATAQQFLKASADSAAKSIDDLNKEQKALTKELENSTKAATAFDSANDKASADNKKKTKKGKEDVTPRVEAIPKLVPVKSTDDQNDKLLKIMRDQLSEDLTNLKEKGVEVNIPIQATGQIENFSAYANALKQAEEDTKIFADGAGSAINALAGELTSSLETGNKALDAFVGSVIQGLAQVAAAQLTGLIAKQAVATASLATDAAVSTGNAVVAATETASSTGPAAAFVLPALVGAAIGFIAAAFAGIKFAHGGIVPGGSFTGDKIPAMLNSGETVMNSQQQANTLMAIANGNSNALQGNRVAVNYSLETKLRGADLLLSVKREERKR